MEVVGVLLNIALMAWPIVIMLHYLTGWAKWACMCHDDPHEQP